MFDTSICWAVLAPLPASELERVAVREWKREFPHAIDSPPWEAISGAGDYNALISRSPGTEGSDRYFAEVLSKRACGKTVYSLWFDPEREHIFEWKDCKQVASRAGDPSEVAESLRFTVSRHGAAGSASSSVAVVEDASVQDVRRALGDLANEGWIHIAPGPVGVLVTAHNGPLGTQAWDLAESLPTARVYYVQRRPDEFTVLVLRGSDEIGRFRIPPLDDDTEMLSDIKGARRPVAIAKALGIHPELLGLS